jgi:geranylgeranyl pyrophosphate synthase
VNPVSSAADPALVTTWLSDARIWAESVLERNLALLDLGPPAHSEALRYALFGGGKRLRPALVKLACQELGGTLSAAGPAAAAVEMVHTYSLVHDDLPCMDDDDLRRGRPTTHKVFGEDQAVLVGDGLQALAFELLAREGGPNGAEMVAVLARASGPAGMVGGQALDLLAESNTDSPVSADAVREIHRHKTAALIAASAELGALAADAVGEQRSGMRAWGMSLGLLFQAVDDLLDVTGSAEELGKTPGKDADAGKATLVAALGFEGARAEAERLADQAREAALSAGCPAEGRAVALVEWLLARRS